jgi:hypothetical protein
MLSRFVRSTRHTLSVNGGVRCQISMYRYLAFTILLFFVTPAIGLKWECRIDNQDSNYIQVFSSDKGTKTIGEAIDGCPRNTKLKFMIIGGLHNSPSFQEDIGAYFSEYHPDLLKGALSSSGNMHNPKVVSLIKPFMKAFPTTRMMNDVYEQLKGLGYAVESTYHEKFSLIDSDESPKYSAVLYLNIVEKAPNQSPKKDAKKESRAFCAGRWYDSLCQIKHTNPVFLFQSQ